MKFYLFFSLYHAQQHFPNMAYKAANGSMLIMQKDYMKARNLAFDTFSDQWSHIWAEGDFNMHDAPCFGILSKDGVKILGEETLDGTH